jgi:proline dehydrogenase
MLDRIATVPKIRDPRSAIEGLNISIKLTQCGLDQGEAFAEANYREVVRRAVETHTFVRIDMEASEYTERTVEIVERVFREFPNTGTVLQSYLRRTDDDVERMVGLGARVRLVKGAYLEPETVAYPDKPTVDAQFVKQGKRLLDAGNYPALATHDEAAIREFKAHAEREGIDKSRFEFQMLYGIRRDLQDSLRKEGYNVRVYVPFGDAWYPYFTRRLAERPANALFILKSLFKG